VAVGILSSPHHVIIPKVVNPALFLDAALCLLRGVANGVNQYGGTEGGEKEDKERIQYKKLDGKSGMGQTKWGNSERRIIDYHKNRRQKMKIRRKKK